MRYVTVRLTTQDPDMFVHPTKSTTYFGRVGLRERFELACQSKEEYIIYANWKICTCTYLDSIKKEKQKNYILQ